MWYNAFMQKKNDTIVAGIRASGTPHIGNYLGAMKQFIELQDNNECFFFIADLHSLTTPFEPKEQLQNALNIAVDYLALGLNPEKCTLFLQSQVSDLIKGYDAQENAKFQSLVKIYENMKPKEAAKIFEQLDMPILLDVVERMKEQKVSPILAEMDPSKAKTVTTEMAQQRQMPIPKPASGG